MATKSTQIWSSTKGGYWSVACGKVPRSAGRPSDAHLFKLLGEKLPFDSLRKVQTETKDMLGANAYGVYIAHDSMGHARYIGRGNIFSRLKAHKRRHFHELHYFSFFVVESEKHEREIETLLIHGAGPLLQFNERKKRLDIKAGSPHDFMPGTIFFRRTKKRGPGPRYA